MIWVFGALAADPVLRFDRLDLVSEDPGRWLVDEVPRATVSPRLTTLRWIEQLKVSVAIPRASLVVGASYTSQSVSIRRPLTRRVPLFAHAGVTMASGLPRGALVGAEYWRGPVRFGLGVHTHASATWARPVWDSWRVLPGIGIGIGQAPSLLR